MNEGYFVYSIDTKDSTNGSNALYVISRCLPATTVLIHLAKLTEKYLVKYASLQASLICIMLLCVR